MKQLRHEEMKAEIRNALSYLALICGSCGMLAIWMMDFYGLF